MTSPRAKQVASYNRRARERGLIGMLTTLDWQRTLDAFNHTCAYCQHAQAWTLDHFQPTAQGGGTTMSNVLPSCTLCNTRKASRLPDELELSFVSAEQLMIIRTYLEAIGKRNQENWRRLCEREPAFARMDEKRKLSFDP